MEPGHLPFPLPILASRPIDTLSHLRNAAKLVGGKCFLETTEQVGRSGTLQRGDASKYPDSHSTYLLTKREFFAILLRTLIALHWICDTSDYHDVVNRKMNASENILVSIIIPTYNRKRFICESIDSALKQTWNNIELIVIDDGSTDGTGAFLEKYSHDKRFHYYYQRNKGQSTARNNGISRAKGDYIAFLDSDDVWLPDKLEKQLNSLISNPGYDVYYGDVILIDESGNEISRKNPKKYSGKVTNELLGDNFISMCTTLTKRECFLKNGTFDESDRLAEDYELWLRFSINCKFFYIPEYLSKYRVMEDQLSSDAEQRLVKNEEIIRKFIKTNKKILTKPEVNRGLSYFYSRKARHEGRTSRLSKAIISLAQSFYHDPLWAGPWRTMARLMLGSRD